MKSASSMRDVKAILRASGHRVAAAENCTMDNEHLYYGVEEIPDDSGYFSLIIAKSGADK